MAKQQALPKLSPFIGHTNVGAFSKTGWLREADAQFAVSKLLRGLLRKRRMTLRQAGNASRLSNSPRVTHYLTEAEGAARSSHLLLGYAVELTLKAALPALCRGCTETYLSQQARKFGHRFPELAKEIGIPLATSERETLKSLSEIVLNVGRYPIEIGATTPHSLEWNRRIGFFWSEENYRCAAKLRERFREFVRTIDQDEGNPASIRTCTIDEDGYLAFRCGGNIEPRITVKYSSYQIETKQNNSLALKKMITPSDILIREYWDAARFREASC